MTKVQIRNREEVLRDVLKQLPILNIATGSYVEGDGLKGLPSDLSGNSQKIARKLQKTCKVCFKGAIFLSRVALKNSFDFDEFIFGMGSNRSIAMDSWELCPVLEKEFTEAEMDLCEAIFEGWTSKLNEDEGPFASLSAYQKQVVFWFICTYQNPKQRLEIMVRNMLDYGTELNISSLLHNGAVTLTA